MTTVNFTSQAHYDFAAAFLEGAAACAVTVQLQPQALQVQVDHPIIARLLARLSNEQAVILPYCGSKLDHWIITANTRRRLDQALARISHFIIPSYAEFGPPSQMPRLKLFEPAKNRLQQIGAQLYPTGYYSWQSPPAYRALIFERLNVWLDLETQQPTLRAQQTPSYHNLYHTFELALAAGNWPEAEACLHELQRLNLSTADNLLFLWVQFWAQQQQWRTIWEHPHFATLAKMRLPRAVKAALITAFHHSELLSLEQTDDWQTALERLSAHKSKLGLLLTARLGLTHGPVVRVFAYLAVLAADRSQLETLLALDVDPDTRRCLAALNSLLPPAAPTTVPPADALTQARLALLNADYDAAHLAADQLEAVVERTLLLLELAFHSNDASIAGSAVSAYLSLSAAQESDLHHNYPHADRYVGFVSDLTAPEVDSPAVPDGEDISDIDDWLAWFAQVALDPTASHLAPALQRLTAVTDDRFWTLERVGQLSFQLLECITNPARLSQPVIRQALQYLTTFFLKESAFPRPQPAYIELYEVLLWGLKAQRQVNETHTLASLRLAEAILSRSPAQRDELLNHFAAWFEKPLPALEQYVIETFELLAEYGLEGWHLVDWYRTWVTHLLNLPTARDRVSLEGWQAFGEWIQPGDDLLHHLAQSLTRVVEQEVDNPVAQLPAGYRIAIFTLRPSSAERSKQLLSKRNPNLDIRICLEKDMNPTVKSLAKNSDLPVVVTSCITHALTYGIRPHLAAEPVYPVSSGSTSIVRAIEEHLLKQPPTL